MADNVDITEGSGKTIAGDDIGGVIHQRIKITIGADGVDDGDVSAANPLPVTVISALPAVSNTEYTEGDTDATFTGIVAMAEGPSNTATPLQVDASKHLQVDIAADSVGIGGGTQYTEGDTDATLTGNISMAEGPGNTATPLQVDASSHLQVDIAADSVGIGGGTQYADGDSVAFPITGTQIMYWDSGSEVARAVSDTQYLPVNVAQMDPLNDFLSAITAEGAPTNANVVQVGMEDNSGNMQFFHSTDGTSLDVTASLSAVDNAVLDNIDTSTAAAATSLAGIDNAVDGNYLNVNANIAGTDMVSGSGTATGALRVELPTNGTGVIATVGAVTAITNALPAGSNTIGNVGASSATGAAVPATAHYVGGVDGSGNLQGVRALSMTDNQGTTVSLITAARLQLYDGSAWDMARGDSTDGLLVNLGSNNDVGVTSVIPGTGATNLGKAKDSAVGVTDTGVAAFGRLRYTPTHSTGSDGAYDTLDLTSWHELRTRDQRAIDIQDCNDYTDFTALSNDTINLADSLNHVFGTGAITFDKTNGAANTVFGAVYASLSSIDTSDIFEDGSFVGMSMYLPSLSNVDYAFIRLGTDASNYNEWQWDSTTLTTSTWMTLRQPTAQPTTYAGNGWDSSAITYLVVGVAMAAESNTLSGIVVDHIHFVGGRVTDTTIDASISSSVTTPNINLHRVGGTPTDTGAGNTSSGTQRVVIASNQAVIPISDNSGSITVDDGGSALTVDGTVTANLSAVDNAVLDSIDTSTAATAASLAGLDNAVDGNYLNVNANIAGTDMVSGSGTATGALRVELPTNGTGVIATVGAVTAITNALPSGTNAIGKLAANSGVDIGDVDVLSVIAGTGATNLGKAEDAGHTTGDTGVFSLGVRNDTLASVTNTTADYSQMSTDQAGIVMVGGAPRALKTSQTTTITSSTAETTVLSSVASTYLDVYGVIVANSSATAARLTFKDATSGTTRFTIYVPAGDTRGFMLPLDSAHVQASSGNNWTATSSASVDSLYITLLAVKRV